MTLLCILVIIHEQIYLHSPSTWKSKISPPFWKMYSLRHLLLARDIELRVPPTPICMTFICRWIRIKLLEIGKAKGVRKGGDMWAVTSLCFRFIPLSLVQKQWRETSSWPWLMAETIPYDSLCPLHKGWNNISAKRNKRALLQFLPVFSAFKLRNVLTCDLWQKLTHCFVRKLSWIRLYRHVDLLDQLNERSYKTERSYCYECCRPVNTDCLR
jgi:hypothetical protein